MAGRRPQWRGGRAAWAVVVLLAAAALAAAWLRRPAVRIGLADAAGPLAERWFEPRLSTVSAWAPCDPPAADEPAAPGPVLCRAGSAGAGIRPALVTESRGAVTIGDASAGADPARWHRDGLWYLHAGTGAAVDRAVSTLRRATRSGNGADAALLNDLAAAHYVRAHLAGDAVDLLHALGAVEQARRRAPHDPAVLFNRALILDRLHLLAVAREAWRGSLAVEPDSGWAVEAGQRLARIPADDPPEPGSIPDAGDDPQAVREWLLESGLGAWAAAAGQDPTAARRHLDLARSRARALQRATGDGLLAAAVAVIDAARRRGDGPALDRLVRAHRLYREGNDRMREREFSRAEPALRAARRALAAAGSPLAGWADFLLLRCVYQRQEYGAVEEPGRAILEAEAARAGGSGASALRGRTWWVLGSARFVRGDLQAAGTAYLRARREFARLGERRNEMAVRSMYANLLEWTGHAGDALQVRLDVLAALRATPDAQRRRLMAPDLAYLALALGEPEAALALQGEAVLVARADGRPLALANALLKRAGLRSRMPDLGPAEWTAADAELAEAARAVDRIHDPGPREATRAQLLLEQGRLWRGTAPQRAAAALDAALAIHAAREAHLLVPEVRLEAARVQRALGHPDAAEAQLHTCLAELERQRATVTSEYQRIVLADRAAQASDELVDLLLAQGRPRQALQVAERGRARRLREWWRAGADSADRSADRSPARTTGVLPSLPDTARLAPDQALLAYRVLPRRLVLWLLTADGLHTETVPVPAARLRELVHAARDAVRRHDPVAGELLTGLHELLIAPVAARLAGRPDLRVVPDDALYRLPFHALRSAATGRYLLEDHRLALSPGLSVGSPGPPRPDARHRAAPRSVLVVADPAFPAAVHPSLPRLAGAAREGVAVAGEYPHAEILDTRAATPAAVLRALGDHDAAHVAAHALPGGRDPFLSRLVLAAADEGADGDLEARELLDAGPRVPRLVVLAACDTVGGHVSDSEGPLGLAWSFLALGAADVVATLWSLDDAASRHLLTDFHRRVAAGVPPPAALRATQRAALTRGALPAHWATLTLFTVRPASAAGVPK